MSEPDVEDADRDAAETAEGTLADTLAEVLPGETAAGTGDGEAPPDEDILERVEQADPEEIAGLFAALGQHVESLEDQLEDRDEELEDLQSRLRRKQADFQNYKKRQKERLAEEKQRATEDLVERLVDVRDNLARALDQDEDADIRDGVETTLRQFDEQLERENVERLEPEPGEEVDPQRHETLATIESDQPEGTVAERHRPGYEMAGKVIRPAQVVTSDEPGDHGDSGAGDSADETAENEAGADS
ncbi:MAG: nucleotide exchange factor GrpE [Halobacteriales archaeon SW_9_67_25]|nr:MAG: nucleotide exchange factor GrpE [Halobacteriales archaeon SW_9_67_25]